MVTRISAKLQFQDRAECGNNSVLYLYPPFAKNQQQRKNKTYFYFRRNSRPRWNDRVCALKTELTNGFLPQYSMAEPKNPSIQWN